MQIPGSQYLEVIIDLVKLHHLNAALPSESCCTKESVSREMCFVIR